MMYRKTLVLFIFCWAFLTGIRAQVTNVRFNHDQLNEKYIITYDLAKESRYNYFDIDILAQVSGIEVRPSLAALSGEVGLNIKYGSKKRIVWDYLIDIEKIAGEVTFKVQARRPALPPPPSQNLDIAIGSGVSAAGLGIATLGAITLLKKGKIDLDANPNREPILYYETYCDELSPYFDFSLAEVANENSTSLCDNHFIEAADEYEKGKVLTSIGGVVAAAGLYILLAKPFYKPKMKAYRKKHNLAFSPTFQINQSPSQKTPEGIVGLRLSYQFGR